MKEGLSQKGSPSYLMSSQHLSLVSGARVNLCGNDFPPLSFRAKREIPMTLLMLVLSLVRVGIPSGGRSKTRSLIGKSKPLFFFRERGWVKVDLSAFKIMDSKTDLSISTQLSPTMGLQSLSLISPLGPPFEKGGMAWGHYMPPATPTNAAFSRDFTPQYVLAALTLAFRTMEVKSPYSSSVTNHSLLLAENPPLKEERRCWDVYPFGGG